MGLWVIRDDLCVIENISHFFFKISTKNYNIHDVYNFLKNVIFFPVTVVVPTAMPTLFIFNLESLSPEPARLDPFSIHFMPQVTYTLLPTSLSPTFCSDHNQDVRDEAELK